MMPILRLPVFRARWVAPVALAVLGAIAAPHTLAQSACTRAAAVTPDGGRYCGPLVNGTLHGRGVIEWRNGERYEGEFAHGQMSGKGRLRTAGGDVYEGEFRHGAVNGRARAQMRDGSVYSGQFQNDYFHGEGRYETPEKEVYEGTFDTGQYHGKGVLSGEDFRYQGEFQRGKYAGHGEITYKDGDAYRGQFAQGRYEGKGRFTARDGAVHEGDFRAGEFTGQGTVTRKDGSRYEGGVAKWRFQGKGKYDDGNGTVYEGNFVDGDLAGPGRAAHKQRGTYEGEFQRWRFHGKGVMTLANGDVYKGEFANGVYHGQGTLTYGAPRPDGRKQDSGAWRYGTLVNEPDARQAQENLESALYSQRRLLDAAIAALAPREAGKINMYMLAVAGDGSQEVFRREVEFVRNQYAARFNMKDRALLLVNSRTTLGSAPMATQTSIREALRGIAARMDTREDILFLFLTSHGSREHELSLTQNNMNLRGLPAKALAGMLRESGIRWKVIVVSACYSGGFIDHLKDEHTLIVTAARHDRQSFGCADENDFTYFGRAFFKEALPHARSFEDAYGKAATLVREWEERDQLRDAQQSKRHASGNHHSHPQLHSAPRMKQHLQRWWEQHGKER